MSIVTRRSIFPSCQRSVWRLLPLIGAFACTNAASTPPAEVASAELGSTSGTDAAPAAGENLLPNAALEGYRRVPIDPLAEKAVWTVRPDGTLFIDGAGAKEMLLSEREFGDGVLHVEWRFVPPAPPADGKPVAFNGGVYVRTAPDGKSYVQLQVAHAEKPPVVGDLIAQVPASTERVDVFQAQPAPVAPEGEWNTYDITTHGPTIELRVNGQPSVTWPACPMLTGHVGLQAEGSPIEVRALRFQPL